MEYVSLDDLFIRGVNNLDDLYFLNHYKDYSTNGEPIHVKYKFDPFLVQTIRDIYPDFPSDKSEEFKYLVDIRKWVNKQLYIPDVAQLEQYDQLNWNTLSVLKKMSHTPFACDCGTYSMVLTEILLSLGYKAKWVQCLPMDLRFEDCHTVVQVFVGSLNKWIILDPAFNCCYFDGRGTVLNLAELRTLIQMRARIMIPQCPSERKTLLLEYWTKNIFRFRGLDNYCFNFMSHPKTYLYLHPRNFCVKDKSYEKDAHLYFYDEKMFWE